MDNRAPFSVLISVYAKNTPDELFQSIKSIWDDQVLKPSQIVLVEDGCLPNELQKIIDYWEMQEPTIFTVIKLHQNMGLAHALNRGLEFCKYDLVARMDADDVSMPDRFAKQYGYMIHHPDIDVLGGQVEEWDGKLEKRIARKSLPLSHHELQFFTKYRCPFNHPTVIFRKESVVHVGGYPNCKLEDNNLWVKMLLNGRKFSNLDSVLVKMRADNMIKSRRGLNVLLPELQLQKYLYDSGINNFSEFMVNCVIRIILRTLPNKLRATIYKNFR